MAAGRQLWAALHLLDRQLVDSHGVSAGKVDDLEFTDPGDSDELPVLTEILSGSAALSRRFNRHLSRGLELGRRFIHPVEEPGPGRISFGVVTHIGTDITLMIDHTELDNNVTEQWLAREILSHIPGAGLDDKETPT